MDIVGESVQDTDRHASKIRRNSLDSIAECLCVEFCAGSARLSSALKERGFAVIPVDWDKNRHTTYARCINIDLTKPGARILFKQILATGRLRYPHFGPPCGTGSKAREKPISQALRDQGAPSPEPMSAQANIHLVFLG
jgi:hypothetical protein